MLKNNENRFIALQINRQQSDATYVSLSNRTRSDELFDVINLIAFKHMLVRPRDIGYYRKKVIDRLCILCWINLTVHPRQNRLYVKGMRFSTTRTVSRSPFTCRKLYNATVMPRNICYVLSQNDCINHFQLLSSTLRYTILKDCIPYKNVNFLYICTQLYTALKYFLTQTFNVNINYI